MKVLIADDSPLLRENFLKLISSIETVKETETAHNVPSTIELLKAFQPDVLFLDIRMPGGTGFHVLEFIQTWNNSNKPVVIVFTNYADERNRKKSQELGAHYCFDKTNEFEQAVGVLRTIQRM